MIGIFFNETNNKALKNKITLTIIPKSAFHKVALIFLSPDLVSFSKHGA
ncbi:MAG: hypothetical protein V4596_07015 [Bdellovibrionota bacterium]